MAKAKIAIEDRRQGRAEIRALRETMGYLEKFLQLGYRTNRAER